MQGQTQKEFLLKAMEILGMTRAGLAQRIGVSESAVNKWLSPPGPGDHREMPLIARKFITEILDKNKDNC
jgi:transcriptional regulator with XRE-family HTH domain